MTKQQVKIAVGDVIEFEKCTCGCMTYEFNYPPYMCGVVKEILWEDYFCVEITNPMRVKGRLTRIHINRIIKVNP